MLRTYQDGRVLTVPSVEEIGAVTREIPGTVVKVKVNPGMMLSSLHGQDSYSYELAIIYIGADSQAELLEKYQRCTEMLTFEIEHDETALM